MHLGNGYLARIKSGKLIPTADKFIAISYECGFDINVMLENDFSRYYDSVYIINEALNKLINQVKTDEWYLDNGEDYFLMAKTLTMYYTNQGPMKKVALKSAIVLLLFQMIFVL